jgi:hypothetical protein
MIGTPSEVAGWGLRTVRWAALDQCVLYHNSGTLFAFVHVTTKTLVDALRISGPDVKELGGHAPQEGEDPFFCLLEDVSCAGLDPELMNACWQSWNRRSPLSAPFH